MPEKKKCAHCGKTFTGNKKKRYCSNDCRAAAHYATNGKKPATVKKSRNKLKFKKPTKKKRLPAAKTDKLASKIVFKKPTKDDFDGKELDKFISDESPMYQEVVPKEPKISKSAKISPNLSYLEKRRLQKSGVK